MMQTTSLLKSALRAAALAAIVLAPVATFAATLHPTSNMHASIGGKEKSVRFSLRNQSGASIDLRAGEKTMTIAAGQTVDLKLPIGTRITTASKSDKREAGAVVCEVSSSTADTTIVLN